ncbi:hypothetical protein LOC51_26680 [Rubrivivax sp. JA1024]|nr:hypothetical protein [Rubrivivax sp. JA1024]
MKLAAWMPVAGVAAVSAALVLLTDPPARVPTPTQPLAPLPRLPKLPPPDEAIEPLALLASTTMWGPRPVAGAASGAEEPPPPPRWFFGGTMQLGRDWIAILAFEDGAAPTQMLKAGDRLPDGWRLVEVRRDGVRISAAAAKRPPHGGKAESRWIDLPRRQPNP